MEKYELDLDYTIVDNVFEGERFKKLTPIQEVGIPKFYDEKSYVFLAPTGSGKTMTYLIPTLIECEVSQEKKVSYIIIVPSKELGSQINRLYKKYTERVLFLPSDVGVKRQIEKLKKIKPKVIVGEGDRIIELIENGYLKVDALKGIIVDEGDKVFKKNYRSLKQILKAAYRSVPVYVFSATIRADDMELMNSYREGIELVERKEETGSVKHYYLTVKKNRKLETVFKTLRGLNIKKSIVFINSNRGVEGLKKRILDQSREVFFLHDEMTDSQIQKTLEDFKKSTYSLLFTSDIFSRGLDVPDNECVIHYDLPRNGKIYIHRSGRTSRGYGSGTVVALVYEEEKSEFYKVRNNLQFKVELIAFDQDDKIRVMEPRVKR